MASKKVNWQVGIVLLRTLVDVAVDKESSGAHTVCTGVTAGSHEPTRVRQRTECPSCGRSHSSVFGFEQRGVEVGDKVVLLTQEEIAASSGTPRTGRVGAPPIELAFHSREKVYAATVAGDSVQNIYPDKGGEKAYVALRDALAKHPEVVACAIWAPSTANALWVLEVVGDRIVATKRSWPEQVRATAAVPHVPILDMELDLMEQLITESVSDFDLLVYSNQAKANLDELVAARAAGASPMVTTTTSAPDANADLLATLQASLKAKQPVKKTTAKKAPAKKAAPAKRAPAKKATTRKKVAA